MRIILSLIITVMLVGGDLNIHAFDNCIKKPKYNKFKQGKKAVNNFSSSGPTYYVDNFKGNDSWNGLSDIPFGDTIGPWKSIAKANSKLKAGDKVYIKAGTYSETIRPEASGCDGQMISYLAYSTENVTIAGNSVIAINLSNRNFIKVAGITVKNVDRFIELENGHHNIIENCKFIDARKYACAYLRNATYNQILNSIFSSDPNKFKGADLLKLVSNNGEKPFDRKKGDIGSDHNLIAGNRFGHANHSGLTVRGKFNVIRCNLFDNPHEKNVDISWQKNMKSPWAEGDGEFNVFERNVVRNAGPHWRYAGLALSAPNNIVRFNELYNNKGNGIEIATFGPRGDTAPFADNNRIYHNIIYDHSVETFAKKKWRYNYGIACIEWYKSVYDTRIFNNILYKNNEPQIYGFNRSTIIGPHQPMREKSSRSYSTCFLSMLGSHHNQVNPLFFDETNHDFHLRAQSPYIDAGMPIAVVMGSGFGNSIKLAPGDSFNFTDGYGVVSGDRIWVDKQEAEIISINYKNNKIMLDRPVSWQDGTVINFPFSGNAPDAGAYEFSASELE